MLSRNRAKEKKQILLAVSQGDRPFDRTGQGRELAGLRATAAFTGAALQSLSLSPPKNVGPGQAGLGGRLQASTILVGASQSLPHHSAWVPRQARRRSTEGPEKNVGLLNSVSRRVEQSASHPLPRAGEPMRVMKGQRRALRSRTDRLKHRLEKWGLEGSLAARTIA